MIKLFKDFHVSSLDSVMELALLERVLSELAISSEVRLVFLGYQLQLRIQHNFLHVCLVALGF